MRAVPDSTTITHPLLRLGRLSLGPGLLLVGESGTRVEVPLDDGLVWAAVHQGAIVVQLPDRTGPLAGEPVAALLRRGAAG